MVAISNVFGVAVAVLATAASATKVHAKIGCIIVNNVSTCAWHLKPVEVSGPVEIQACIDKRTHTSSCAWNGTIPKEWRNAYWGHDDCLRSAGVEFLWGVKIGCAEITEPPVHIKNPYSF